MDDTVIILTNFLYSTYVYNGYIHTYVNMHSTKHASLIVVLSKRLSLKIFICFFTH